jgi:hypothetical protein
MSFNLSRLFADLGHANDPMLGVGRGSSGAMRSFHLPFIPEEVAADDVRAEAEGEILYPDNPDAEELDRGDESLHDGSAAVAAGQKAA